MKVNYIQFCLNANYYLEQALKQSSPYILLIDRRRNRAWSLKVIESSVKLADSIIEVGDNDKSKIR